MCRSDAARPTIVIDSREKEPYSFDPRLIGAVRRALEAGDYSLDGLEDQVAVERKTLDDFVSTVIHRRRRFRQELGKLSRYRAACVVVEAELLDVLSQRYRGQARPEAVVGATLSILLDYGVPVVFCGNRQAACHFTRGFLLAAWKRWGS
ncbi:MAG: ERCC4 domain-containing protein [Halothiobacillaceae bacterium]